MAQLAFGFRPPRCGIALGSNLGNRIENLIRAAMSILQRVPEARLIAAAGVYETAPVDCPQDSASFLNTVIEIETDTGPHALLKVLRLIEREMGRADAREKNSPRTIDLDILYLGDRVMDEEALMLPHPRMHLRRFVLQPLSDIRADLVIPFQTRTISELLHALKDDPRTVTLVQPDWLNARV